MLEPTIYIPSEAAREAGLFGRWCFGPPSLDGSGQALATLGVTAGIRLPAVAGPFALLSGARGDSAPTVRLPACPPVRPPARYSTRLSLARVSPDGCPSGDRVVIHIVSPSILNSLSTTEVLAITVSFFAT